MTFPGLDRIEALARNLDSWQRELAGKMTELEDSSAEGVSDSGLVRVTASADGTIVSTDVNARAMRLDSYTLAEEFTAAAKRAQEAAAARVRELVGEVMADAPGGSPPPDSGRAADSGRVADGGRAADDRPDWY
ncbi:YbaB/EbfC family nucleoid-associated protein [Micromonospora sp. LAH09]|uniref:YbaB/EbfC family nucleoid-associated protein n=1 Tax=Micromonospora cabrerizensis TaxID=2911213 RepID=UPI001EE82002|nr:YbaB/EbfC family nucleoid-associated protein [Micromonospora cabrerizensis]MCG5470179.1 YbaB/EbfC family nucleoid-associated protein [Micromonospora cabrerizensis]